MDWGQAVFISSRLVLGALAAFFAIMLWAKTRDRAWMLMVLGMVAAYIETIYSIMELLGITGAWVPALGSVSLAAIVLPALRTGLCIAAFLVMVIRRYRHHV
jgi:hypothetical protein